jgi:hypothetical protein
MRAPGPPLAKMTVPAGRSPSTSRSALVCRTGSGVSNYSGFCVSLRRKSMELWSGRQKAGCLDRASLVRPGHGAQQQTSSFALRSGRSRSYLIVKRVQRSYCEYGPRWCADALADQFERFGWVSPPASVGQSTSRWLTSPRVARLCAASRSGERRRGPRPPMPAPLAKERWPPR